MPARVMQIEKSRIPLGAAEPEVMARPKVASRSEVARGLRASGGNRPLRGFGTTLGDGAFDFRVRNGNGYGSSSMVTGKKPEAGS